ncbi:MAG TPA: Rieske 2Fe-2S domain-containing protein [Candidatus Binatia bacterium]|jgi:carbazole 1,9a-dioxygenase terminal dioxygenase component|nr:Rieske 2Fe-2S domain-containing protein [Candidatus Binatia bacterium]
MAADTTENSEQREIEAFLDDPANHPQVKQSWRPYVEAKLGFRNHWYPALFSHDLEGDEPKPVKILGERILMRRVGGQAFALEDRCAHRRVPFSAKIECYTQETITCWYHGFTYDFRDGKLVGVLTEPGCTLVGKMSIKTYAVQETHGMLFVFVGDGEPPELQDDVPPGFLDEALATHGIRRAVNSNWRLGAENGFDTTHIYIHRNSKFLRTTDALLPLGLIPTNKQSMDIVKGPGPKGVIDKLASNYLPVFESTIDTVKVTAKLKPNGKVVASTVSIWLPCVLRVEDFPAPEITQFEWYVPIDEKTHMYWQVLGKRVKEASAFRSEVDSYWQEVALRGFNDDDVWAREALEDAYTAGEGWTKERLFKPDMCIVEWRKLASTYHRGIQKLG